MSDAAKLETRQRHRERARMALAEHVCSTRLTDGFCHPRHRETCKCLTEADGLLRAMDGVGCEPVWWFDPRDPNSRA